MKNTLTPEALKARAEIIERENSDPEIRARKDKAINDLLSKWEEWGLIKLTDKEAKGGADND